MVELPERRSVSRIERHGIHVMSVRCAEQRGIQREELPAEADVEVLYVREQNRRLDEEEEGVCLRRDVDEKHFLVLRPLAFFLWHRQLCNIDEYNALP